MVFLLSLLQLALAAPVIGAEGRATGKTVDGAKMFTAAADLPAGTTLVGDPQALGRVARRTLDYIDQYGPVDGYAVTGGIPAEGGRSLEVLRATLAFVAKTAEEDAGKPTQRLADPDYLGQRCSLVKWHSEVEPGASDRAEIQAGKVRLTKYLAWSFAGSPTPTAEFPEALYGVPHDEAGLSDQEASARREGHARFRFTRKEVLDGAYEDGGPAPGGAPPLVYVARSSVHEALMQGTVVVRLPDGGERTFNVARNNGIPYDKTVKTPEDQRRFWYFREVSGLLGWGYEPDKKIEVEPGVTVAGDLANIGLGRIVALGEPGGTVRLAVLSDTGGAFQPNLHQLDVLVGTFASRADFNRQAQAIPEWAPVHLLSCEAPK